MLDVTVTMDGGTIMPGTFVNVMPLLATGKAKPLSVNSASPSLEIADGKGRRQRRVGRLSGVDSVSHSGNNGCW